MLHFIHNTYNRPNQVILTSSIEKGIFPECNHLIVYNNNDLKFSEITNTNYFYMGENKGHKAGCINSIYSGLKWLIENKSMSDNDIVVFSHDDVYLSNPDKFKIYLQMMECFNLISRIYTGERSISSSPYIMIESLIIDINLAKKMITNYEYNGIDEKSLPLDRRESPSPEMYFGEKVFNNTNKCHFIEIKENNYGENALGYFHIKNKRGNGEL